MKPLAYIAGPYTHVDPVENTSTAIHIGEMVEEEGFDVVIPHLSLAWQLVSPAPVERWYERDLAVLARCDALVRIPGASTGADREVAFAQGKGIPVCIIDDGLDFHQQLLDLMRDTVGASK